MRTTTALRSTDGSTALERVPVERRDLRADDIAVRIDFCGVCHSDLHVIGMTAKGSVVPGHEFTGVVTEVGAAAGRFAVGDRVAVGTIVDSCGSCEACLEGEEIHCSGHPTATYGVDPRTGLPNHGGYSREYVLRERFAHPLPEGLDPAAAAPLMCAGITVWNPLRAAGTGPGSRVAVAGLGGLGHLAVKLAVALGAEVTVLSRTPDKTADALALGARDLLVTTDPDRLAAARGTFDLVLDTISATHDLSPLLGLVRRDGTLSVLGVFWEVPLNVMDLMLGRRKLTSSATGGLASTAELLAFCAERGITADVEVVPASRAGEALERLGRGDVRYRFVLDLADLD
ncbi:MULTISPECIES: NAD(P)-dependent alcohol dehydrogenase [Actinosynnema]|uniref:NAD(P)-dependent alcohol dehydrogenase n=1 Tax=Actinosynnema TaxID=40566 RepID=UPI0020A253FD|nr:NAD(P)-dependent alcohol dehydrogenase [Actinosynnema pretiosum]MCP2099431.1 putative zinc-type alcohol dehydrogenase-like protein [Actinosynnema pretiosum]